MNSHPAGARYAATHSILGSGWARWLQVALLVVGAAALGACSTSPETRVSEGPVPQAIQQGQGVLAMRLSGNRYGQSNPFNNKDYFKVTNVVVRNIETKAFTILRDRSDPAAGFSSYAESLAPGLYEIASIRNAAMEFYSPGLARTQDYAKLPNFRIAPDQLTDLGGMAIVNDLSARTIALFRSGFVDTLQDNAAGRRMLSPGIAAQVAGKPTLGWEGGASVHEDWLVRASLPNTMRVASPTVMRDGSLWMGESMGQIAQRSKAGAWTWLKTPSALPITAFHLTHDGNVLAGDEGSGVFLKNADTGRWTVVPLTLPDAAVIHLGPYLDTNKILLVLQTRDRYVGFSGDPVGGGAWTQQFAVPRKYMSNKIHDGIAVPLGQGSKFALATGSVEVKPEVTYFDKAQQAWRTVAPDGTNSPRGWRALPGGEIGRFAGIPLTGMYFTASTTLGTSWEKRGDLNWASGSMAFTSAKVGYVVRVDSVGAFDASKNQYSIWRTADAGRTWAKVGPIPVLNPFAELVSLGSDDALAFVTYDGKFRVSSDGGKTWTMDRETP